MRRQALVALTTLLAALPAAGAQDTTTARRPAGTPLEQLVTEESQRRANIARVLLLTNTQVANQQEALKQLSDQLYVDEQLVGATRLQLVTAAQALNKQPSTALVVLLAADSTSASALTNVALSIDGANTNARTYT